MAREHADFAGAEAVLSDSRVDFGVLRRGQTRSFKVTLRNEGGGVLEGRVAAAPGWVRVEPPAFRTRRRQSPDADGRDRRRLVYPGRLCRDGRAGNVRRASGDRRRRQHPACPPVLGPYRLLVPAACFSAPPCPPPSSLVFRCAITRPFTLAQPGFVASGLLFLSAFVLTLAADVAWPPRLLPLGLAGLAVWWLMQTFPVALPSPRWRIWPWFRP